MSKVRVLSDHVANQIAAGEVVERPASVAKELVENSIDAAARRVEVDVEAGGRRLLRVADDGCGMTRDDAVLAFERHATSRIAPTEDLTRINTLGCRGEALASIASVARVELITQDEDATEGTRVLIEGGRMRDVSPAARPRGTTVSVRDLFFNVPARRKFLRSEATESFHLTNLVTHYALAHPEIAFALTNNGREVLRAGPAANLRERAYQIFGAEFLEHLLEVEGGHTSVAHVRGYVSAPRERRTTGVAQCLVGNGRYVRDVLVARSLTEGYRSALPHGVYPAALLFIEVPTEEVDVNVHPAKTEVRFRRASAVADAVRDAVRGALATNGYLRLDENFVGPGEDYEINAGETDSLREAPLSSTSGAADDVRRDESAARQKSIEESAARQESIEFGFAPHGDEPPWRDDESLQGPASDLSQQPSALDAITRNAQLTPTPTAQLAPTPPTQRTPGELSSTLPSSTDSTSPRDVSHETGASESTTPAASAPHASHDEGHAPRASHSEGQTTRDGAPALPPLNSAAGLMRESVAETLTPNIRPLGQLEDSFIIATDAEGLLLIDQHV